MSSSSSSLQSGSCSAGPELPLIACKICKGVVRELVSKQSETTWRKFYRCNSMKADGTKCDFFHWQGSYAVLLIKDGIVTDSGCVLELLMIALDDHDKAVTYLTKSIRETKQKLHNLEFKMEELDNLNKSMMAENVENKKSTAAALEQMKDDLQKLKDSTTVKHRNMALCFLLLALIGWFVMGHMNVGEEAFSRLMLSP